MVDYADISDIEKEGRVRIFAYPRPLEIKDPKIWNTIEEFTGIALAVVFDDSLESVIFIDREDDRRRSLKSPPGGKKAEDLQNDKTESSEECVRRELLEETGITSDMIEEVFPFRYFWNENKEEYIMVYCVKTKGKPSLVQNERNPENPQWYSRDEVLTFDNLFFRQVTKKIIKEITKVKTSSN